MESVYEVLVIAEATIVYCPPAAVERYTLYPATSLDVLADQLSFTGDATADTPVPDKLTDGEDVALLAIETFPVALPAVVGANVTVSVALCPADNVAGVLTPLPAKPVPLTLICERFSVALPEFVIVSV